LLTVATVSALPLGNRRAHRPPTADPSKGDQANTHRALSSPLSKNSTRNDPSAALTSNRTTQRCGATVVAPHAARVPAATVASVVAPTARPAVAEASRQVREERFPVEIERDITG